MVAVPSIFSAIKEPSYKERKKIFEGGYFTMGGMVAGMIAAEVWEKYNMPGTNVEIKTSLLNGNPIQNSNLTSQDRLYQYLIAGGLILLEMLFNIKGGIASGTGFFLGINFVDKSNKQSYIGDV